MESKSLEAIQEQLQKERIGIDSKAQQLRSELALLDSDLVKIDAAIAALSGKATPPASAKVGKSKKRKSTQGPAAGKADVIKLVHAVLEAKGVVEASALKILVEEKLLAAGFTRMGFSLRFKEALGDSQFVDSPAGLRLKQEKQKMAKV